MFVFLTFCNLFNFTDWVLFQFDSSCPFSYILPSHGLEGTHGDGGESFWTIQRRTTSQEWGATNWQEPGSLRLWSCIVSPGLLTLKCFRKEKSIAPSLMPLLFWVCYSSQTHIQLIPNIFFLFAFNF